MSNDSNVLHPDGFASWYMPLINYITVLHELLYVMHEDSVISYIQSDRNNLIQVVRGGRPA